MQKSAPPPTRPLAAIGLMCLTCAIFACLDTTAKYLGSGTNLPMAQVVWMRFLGQFVGMVALLGLVAVPDLLRTRKLALQIVRSFLLLGSTAFNFVALCMAFFGIVTRYLAAFDRAEVTLFYSLLAGTLMVAPFALADWVWPAGLFVWLLLLSMGLYGGLGHYAFIIAHRHAPASTLAPFLYVSLVTHSTAGFLVFGQVPDRWTLAGAAIVIATGLYLLHRERATARAAAVAMTSEAASQR